eukprot:m.44493 g.44493  ORF g.44493 m.44493 type:complete len:350 (-) comp10836_c0_seq1:240-1289(-)
MAQQQGWGEWLGSMVGLGPKKEEPRKGGFTSINDVIEATEKYTTKVISAMEERKKRAEEAGHDLGGHGHSHGGEPCHGHGHDTVTAAPGLVESAPTVSIPDAATVAAPKAEAKAEQKETVTSAPTAITSAPTAVIAPVVGEKQTQGMITKDQFVRFCKKFTELIILAETKQRLKDAIAAGRPVEDETTAIQREIFERMDIDGEFGVKCLGSIRESLRDYEVTLRFQHLIEIESLACDEAECTPEEFLEKLQQYQAGKQRAFAMMAMQQQMQQMMRDPAQLGIFQERMAQLGQQGQVSQMQMMQNMQRLAAARQQWAQQGLSADEMNMRMLQMMGQQDSAMTSPGAGKTD